MRKNASDWKVDGLAGTIGGLAAIVLWSTTIGLVRSLSEQIGPLTAAAAVQLLAGAAGLVRPAFSSQARRDIAAMPRTYLFGGGGLFIVYMLTLYLAVGLASDRNEVLVVGLLNYLWPALLIVFSLPLLKKRASWILIPATLLALAGVFLVMVHGSGAAGIAWTVAIAANPGAYGLGLAAALSWALYSIWTSRCAADRPGGAVELFLPAAGLALGALLFAFPESSQWNARAFAETGFLAAATYLAYSLWDRAMRQGNVTLVASCAYFTPLLSTLVSCVYLDLPITIHLIVGCGLVIAGSVLSWRSVSDPP